MRAILIGSGNVATNLARGLTAAGVTVMQVYSRTIGHAEELAHIVGASATDSLADINRDADIYIVSVNDDVIASVVASVSDNGALWVHTSGSTPINVFVGLRKRYGVLYPMQSFSKQIAIDFSDVPFFVEGDSEMTTIEIESVAHVLSRRVYRTSSEQRKRLHIAAVFSCNFANHLWTLADDVLSEAGLPFDVMLPLISNTVGKLYTLSPFESQTGPAIRHDYRVMKSHSAMLDKYKQKIYEILSKSIIKRHE